ncbi:MAG: hypothetical protein HDT41_00425 [Lachnospiraceae bacterium]|nr:hypothetical protein [Lachnospiraceae bacterium]
MQSGVDITFNEANLDIKYGMLNLREERELARASFKYIAVDMNNIQRYYIKLGFHLCEAKNCKYYEDFGYDKFEDFVAANFGMEKSALSRCMNVYLRFFAKAQHDSVIAGCPRTKNKYEDYSYSQLCEIVSISDDKIKEITPDMTVKQIREFKKNCNKPVVDSNIHDVSWLAKNKKNSSGVVPASELSDKSKDCKDIPVATSQPDKIDRKPKTIYSGFSDNKFKNDLFANIEMFIRDSGLEFDFIDSRYCDRLEIRCSDGETRIVEIYF